MRYALACCLLLSPLATAAASLPTLVLRPDAPALEQPRVPALGEPVADADRLPDSGLSMEPEHPYRWVFSPGEPVRLRVAASAAATGGRAVLSVWNWELRPVAQQVFDLPCRSGNRLLGHRPGHLCRHP